MFHDGVITMDGLELDTKIRAGLATAVFTSIKFGDGLYDGTEDLSQCSGMKSVRQSFGISSICVIDKKQVRLRTVTDNTGIGEGYYISELGVYAEDPDKGEILYSLSLGVPQKMDYQPSETELAGATGTFDVYTDVSNVEEATVAVGTGAAASAEDLAETNTRVDGLMNPEFEDYSGEGAEVPDAREAIANIRSKKGFTGIMSNIKAALMGLVTLGEIRGMLVNNGLCSEAGKFFLDAAYGKNLQDQLTKLNSDLTGENYNGDLDNALTSGVYWCTAAYTTNRPTQDAGSLWVNGKDQALFASQLFVTATAKYFFRSRANGIWTSWVELVSKIDLTPTTPQTILSQCKYSKSGNVVIVSCQRPKIEIPANTWTALFNMPVGYRPNFDIHFVAVFGSDGSKPGAARIMPSGECSVFSKEATTAPWFTVSFLVGS